MRFEWKSVAFVMAGLFSVSAAAVDVALPGVVSGNAAVTPSGSVAYKIPLSLPRSLGGVAPQLSFDYSSANQTQSGLMGVGWSVGGLQQISRCPQSRAQDGQLKGVSFTEHDRFCLNGSRLIKVAGAAYGASGTEYRTEIDSITKVVSYGVAGSGPEYFRVWQKDGSILEFGSTSNARVLINSTDAAGVIVPGTTVFAWGLNRVEDPKTNYWTVSYGSNMGYGVLYPTEILYAGNVRANALPANKVVFNYGIRPAGDDTLQFVAGSLIKQSHRITSVAVYAGSQQATEYRFRYQSGDTAFHSRIDEIKECHLKDGNHHCLDPVQIAWSSEENLLTVPPVSAQAYSTSFSGIPSNKYEPIVADVSGDARADIVYPALQAGVLQLRVMRARAGVNSRTFDAPVSSSHAASFPSDTPKYQLADLDRDGRADLVVAFIGVGGFTVYVFRSNGDGTFSSPEVSTLSSAQLTGTYRFMAADVNADGVTDFAAMKADVASAMAEVRVAKRDATGDVGIEQVSTITLGAVSSPVLHDMAIGDANGDGYPDAMFSFRAGASDYGVYTSLGDGSGGFAASAQAVIAVASATLQNGQNIDPANYWASLIDVNRDGLVDVLLDQSVAVWLSYPTYRKWFQSIYTGVARGNGGFEVRGLPPAGYFAMGNAVPAEILGWIPVYQDFDGNGTLDMLRFGVDNYAQWWALLTSGTATGEFSNATVQGQISGSVPTPAIGVAAMGTDTNADGVPDIVLPMVVDGGAGNQKLSVVVTRVVDDADNSKPKQQNMVKQITRGTLSDQFTYSPLPWNMGEANPLYVMDSDAVYPQQDLNMPLMVASSVAKLRSGAVQESTAYKYKGAKADIANGRGFLGFREVVATTSISAKRADGSTQQLTQEQLTRYRQDFPYIGMPVLSTTKANNILVAKSESNPANDFSVNTPYAGVYQPQLNRTVSDSYDPVSGALLSVTEQVRQFDAFGNVESESSTITSADQAEAHFVSAVNTYSLDTVNWRVSQQSGQTTTLQRTGRPTIVRQASFGYDADGVRNQEVTEPNLPELRVQTDYAHDAYGNISSVTVSGSGDPAYPDTAVQSRTAQMLYEAGADHPAGVFNTREIRKPQASAADQAISRTFDPLTGAVKTQTDANNLTTTFAFDAIGRETSRNNPDGTSVVTDRMKCASFWSIGTGTTGCETGEYLRTTITQTGMAPAYVFTDNLNREVRKVTRAFDGVNFVIARTEYDEAGRVKRTNKPALNTVAYAAQQWTTYEYDGVGRVTKQTQPGARVTTNVYSGLETTVTNPKGQSRTEFRNMAGELWRVRDADNQLLTYELDALGRITRTTDAKGNQVVFVLDKLGRKLQQQDPDLGMWNYRYDVLGQLVWQRDAKQQVTTFAYDLLGRRTSQLTPDLSSYWQYDSATKGVGQLARAWTDAGYERTHTYDAYGRPSAETTIPGSASAAMVRSKTYDAAGRVEQIIYPGSVGYKNVYDAATGLLKEVRNISTNALYWGAQAQDAEGRVTHEVLGNGLSTFRTYKADSGLIDTVQTGIEQAGGIAARVQNDVYSFDLIGNLDTRMEMLANRVETFDYDDLNRLKNVYEAGVATQSMTYDEIGNLRTRSDVGTYTYTGCGGVHRVCSTSGALNSSYSYDANGNMLSGRGNTYTWLGFNKPARISNSTSQQDFLYDAEQERVRRLTQRVVNGVTKQSQITYLTPRIDLGGTFEREQREDGSQADTWHVYAGSQVVASVTQEGAVATVRYLHGDHIGSISAITDSAGKVVERRSYDAWGKRRAIFGDDQAAATVQWQSGLSVAPTTANPNAAGITMPAAELNKGLLIQWANQALVFDVRTNRRLETPVAKGQTAIAAGSNVRQRGVLTLSSQNPGKRYMNFGMAGSGTAATLRRYGLVIRGTTVYAEKCEGITVSGEASCVESSLGQVVDGATYTAEVVTTGSTALVRMYTAGNALNPEFVKAEQLDWTAGNTPGLTKSLWMGASGKRAWLPLGVMLPIKGRGSPITVDDLVMETYVPATSLNSELSRHGFTGHEMLDDQELVHMNGRVYDPVMGRFVSADPNVFYPENMQDLNRYSYVHNNPLSLTDPDGFVPYRNGVYDGAFDPSRQLNDFAMGAIDFDFNMNSIYSFDSVMSNPSTGQFSMFGANYEAKGGSEVSYGFTAALSDVALGDVVGQLRYSRRDRKFYAEAGDSYMTISQQLGVSVESLLRMNHYRRLVIGNEIGVPSQPNIDRFMWAADQIGSTRYAYSAQNGIFQANTNKCNLFVSDAFAAGGTDYPRNSIFGKSPMLAGRVASGDAGDLTAHPVVGAAAAWKMNFADASGHIVIYTGTLNIDGLYRGGAWGSIGAGSESVNYRDSSYLESHGYEANKARFWNGN